MSKIQFTNELTVRNIVKEKYLEGYESCSEFVEEYREVLN